MNTKEYIEYVNELLEEIENEIGSAVTTLEHIDCNIYESLVPELAAEQLLIEEGKSYKFVIVRNPNESE